MTKKDLELKFAGNQVNDSKRFFIRRKFHITQERRSQTIIKYNSSALSKNNLNFNKRSLKR